MKIKKEHIQLICILLIGIAARLMKFGDQAIVTDSVAYSRLGKHFIEYGRYVFGENYNMGVFFPPGYSIFTGVLDLFVNDLLLSARIISFTASCITIILSYLVGKEIYNKEAGLFAALVYALYPVILIISVDSNADALFFCFLLITIYMFFISLRKDNISIHALLGMSFGITFLVRPEGVFLLILPLLQIFGVFGGKKGFNFKYLFKVGLILIIFLVMILPYMIFLKNYTGKLTLSGKGNISILLSEVSSDRGYHEAVVAPDNLYDRAAFTLTKDKTQLMGWNRNVNRSLSELVLKDPFSFSKKYLRNVILELKTLFKLLLPVLIPLCFVFMGREVFRNRLRLIFIAYPLLFFLIYPVFLIIEKQTLLIAFFIFYFACGGYALSSLRINEIAVRYGISGNAFVRFLEKSIKAIIVAVLICSSLVYLKYSSFEHTSKPVEHERAGNYLKQEYFPAYKDLNVMGRKPFVSFYSNSRFTMLPYAGTKDVVDFAKLYNVDFIAIDERALSRWDYYDELTEMHKHSDKVELVYEDTTDFPIRLFKIIY